MVSAYRKPRYVLQKVVEGVPSDWQWYTQFGAWEREALPATSSAGCCTTRVLKVAGNPADFGAPERDPDIAVAGHLLSQDYLAQVAGGAIACRPAIAAIAGRTVTFVDGQRDFEATSVPPATSWTSPTCPRSWPPTLRSAAGAGDQLDLDQGTLPPGRPALGVVGQFLAQGPYFPLLELQARWVVGIWAGEIPTPGTSRMRDSLAQPQPPVRPLNVFATVLARRWASSLTAVPA